MKRSIIPFVLFLTAAGCETSGYDPRLEWNPPPREREVAVEVITDPPGCVIECNDSYVGRSPCTVTMLEKQGYLIRNWKITALPRSPGGYTQTKRFEGSLHAQKPPEKIYFDMRLVPVPPTLDVNLR